MQTYLGDGFGLDALLGHATPVELAHRATDRANTYRTLAHIFNHAPDASFVERMRSIDPIKLLPLNTNADVRQGLDEIIRYVEDTRDYQVDNTAEDLARDWTRLVRGLSPRLGPVPPFESLYRGRETDEISTLHTLAQVYWHSGAAFENTPSNRHDYIGVELDYLRFLSEKEADAWLHEDNDAAWRWLSSVRAFVREHLDLWAGTYCDGAIVAARTDFYRGFLRICKAALDDLSG